MLYFNHEVGVCRDVDLNSGQSKIFKVVKAQEEREIQKMVTTVNALDMIDAELSKAAAPKASNKRPVFLFLKEGHKVLVRPLFNLQDSLVLQRHNKYSDTPEQRVNAICATEIGKSCVYCEQAATDRKLTANIAFYLPVYVYSVMDTKTGQQITYKDPETQQDKPVSGIRVLELTSFGTIGAVLKFFREFTKDPDNGPMTEYDFTITQVGSGQQKSFVCMPKAAKPMSAQMQQAIPPVDLLRSRLLEACPPLTSATAANDTDPAIAAVRQDMNNGQARQVVHVGSSEGDDGFIPDF